MRKSFKKCLITFALISLLAIILNIPVTTRQGIDYQVKVIRIPLFLKTLDFLSRHYNYMYLVKRITHAEETPAARAMSLFKWVYRNIRKMPDGLPAVDDHVWHIIVRGYGTSDQANDVFTVLCNYAHVPAFFTKVMPLAQGGKKIAFSFVQIDKDWFVFDAYRGVFFQSTKPPDSLATIECLKFSRDWKLCYLDVPPDIDYTVYIQNMPTVEEIVLTRANIQSPLNRLIYEFKKIVR